MQEIEKELFEWLRKSSKRSITITSEPFLDDNGAPVEQRYWRVLAKVRGPNGHNYMSSHNTDTGGDLLELKAAIRGAINNLKERVL